MIVSNFVIKNREITRIDQNKLIGIVGQDTFKVDFRDEEWEGLHKTMKLIRSDGEVFKFAMTNDEVLLTQECYISGYAQLGFYGTINEDDPEDMEIVSTDYIPIYFTEHAYDTADGEQQNLPTPSQWDIIIGQMNSVKDDIDNMKTELEGEVGEIEEKLENGDYDGRGIVNNEKISTEGKVDTYRITYTDNTYTDYTVTNGQDGIAGDYNDLINKPTIPTNTSQLVNDSNYISSTVITAFWKGTQEEYDLIEVKNPTTLYLIEEGE